MAILIKEAKRSSHWYTRDGLPMHEVRRSKPGPDGQEMRQTTIADARLLGLFPSVTGVLDIFDKPQLVTWKVNQAILSTLRFPKQEHEAEDYYCKRIREAANEQVEEAKDLGGAIHGALDMVMEDGTLERCEDELRPYVSPVLQWFHDRPMFRILGREQVVVNVQEGFAGTFDMAIEFPAPDGSGPAYLIVDYKTRKTKPGVEVKAYDFQSWQIAAYARTKFTEAFNLGKVYGVNIFVSSTEPGRITHIRYMPEQLLQDFNSFRSAAAIWRAMKDYDPRKERVLTEEEKIKVVGLLPAVTLFTSPVPTGPTIIDYNRLGAEQSAPQAPAAPAPWTPPGYVPPAPPVAITAPAVTAVPLTVPPAPVVQAPAPGSASSVPLPEGSHIIPADNPKRKRRTKAEMEAARVRAENGGNIQATAAAMGSVAVQVNTPEVKPDIPPPVHAGPPVPGADGQVAVVIQNWIYPFVRVQCTFVNMWGCVFALIPAIKPKDRPPVLIPDDFSLICPVTGLMIMSHEKVKCKGKGRDAWLDMARTIASVSGSSDADIAETYRTAIQGKTPSPPLDQISFLVQ